MNDLERLARRAAGGDLVAARRVVQDLESRQDRSTGSWVVVYSWGSLSKAFICRDERDALEVKARVELMAIERAQGFNQTGGEIRDAMRAAVASGDFAKALKLKEQFSMRNPWGPGGSVVVVRANFVVDPSDPDMSL